MYPANAGQAHHSGSTSGRSRHRRQLSQPGQCRVLPDLAGRLEQRPLVHTAEPDDDGAGVFGGTGVQRRATARTKNLRPPVAAGGGLEVTPGRAAQHKTCHRRADDGAKGSARQHLAIGAMAQQHLRGIDLGREGDGPAMATAGDLHAGLGCRVDQSLASAGTAIGTRTAHQPCGRVCPTRG